MSAWYVFATLGFYPVDASSGAYVAGIPLTDHARIKVPGRRALQIERVGQGDHLRQVKIAGQIKESTNLPHHSIMNGGMLRFELGEAKQ